MLQICQQAARSTESPNLLRMAFRSRRSFADSGAIEIRPGYANVLVRLQVNFITKLFPVTL
ncbi:hypothetical protein CS542_08065 [Pedobacter sp. IW39]|nr:hypothetical protein CS542_08065 [Pedobacter sp. IW39]